MSSGEMTGRVGTLRDLARRLLPLLILAAVGAAIFAFDLDSYLSFETLKTHRDLLIRFVVEQALLAVALFILVYAAATAISLPGAALLSVSGGFLFGPWLGTVYVVIGATIGATAVFLIARTALGDSLRHGLEGRAGPTLKAMEQGFRENALSYLLMLRLIPLFPFFVVNLVPAFLGMPLRSYVIGTFIGIIPGAFVFVFAGAGLGSLFDSSEAFSLAAVVTPEILIALTGLGLLALLPVAYKKLKARRA
ncbi:MAG: TVP38/TMEM64 family protein [Kiloniellales bacterium]